MKAMNVSASLLMLVGLLGVRVGGAAPADRREAPNDSAATATASEAAPGPIFIPGEGRRSCVKKSDEEALMTLAKAPAMDPYGPCQCHDEGCLYDQHFIGVGASSCQQAGVACIDYLKSQNVAQCNSSTSPCDVGSPCNKNYIWGNCRYVTCGGQPCGYEVDCTAIWGCFYCG